MKSLQALILVLLFCVQFGMAQEKKSKDHEGDKALTTYVIEREIPDIGESTPADLTGISQKSCSVLKEMDADKIQWIHSYVAENKIYCIYKAENEDLLREHASKGGFPINSISVVSDVISPKTAEGQK
ncbi:DUF4242 domain-containing protein [Gramella jeungdoensis]|uniref:DUF4242 domain-containing protein n=1 Tax=Gramella jeungdoensis TaxID=708091 RepID=A0ABT0YZA2_9FLAO|nr:DUF4242 domain-containing protein [Gramella jeungdoensis]MCM8568789.1 DUF4242 domain-containing protein [Gramella jeungdoensis]